MKKEITYGQLKEDGTPYSWAEFETEVVKQLKRYVLFKPTKTGHSLIKKLFKKGYSVSDTISLSLLNSK